MIDWIAIIVALFLFSKSEIRFKAILFVLSANFIAHKLAYIGGVQLTNVLNYQYIYIAYSLIQLATIITLINIKSHFAILIIVLIQLGYNMLTVSQYIINTYDFYSFYAVFMQALMALELFYMGMLTNYARDFRGLFSTNDSNWIVRLCRRYNHRGLF